MNENNAKKLFVSSYLLKKEGFGEKTAAGCCLPE